VCVCVCIHVFGRIIYVLVVGPIHTIPPRAFLTHCRGCSPTTVESNKKICIYTYIFQTVCMGNIKNGKERCNNNNNNNNDT